MYVCIYMYDGVSRRPSVHPLINDERRYTICLALLWSNKKGGKFASSFTSPVFFLKKILLWSDCEAKKS